LFWQRETPLLRWGRESQPYQCGRASYELAGCRRLTSFESARWRPEMARRRVIRIRIRIPLVFHDRGRASGPFRCPHT